MRNHLGSYECKLCLTLHTNEGIVQGLYGNCGDITCCQEATLRTRRARSTRSTWPDEPRARNRQIKQHAVSSTVTMR